ncbi:hypothetical protein R3P38DRAFT_3125926 [Favolaschia claudopus]|uniref:G domain-containing protein n=1 Tax=Favolaschia claudopus TaxID=2862362 RepID=A0AAV9ZBN9_9AGAR
MDTLPLVCDEILAEFQRLRLLIVGKPGAGKSSLLRFAFGVDSQSVKADINEEITFRQNPRLVLHQCEPDATGALSTFLQKQTVESVSPERRVHLIWLCIKVPDAGISAIEKVDEQLLGLAVQLKVPVVVVFTQFDALLNSTRFRFVGDISEEREKAAEAEFDALCRKPLHALNERLLYARTAGLSESSGIKPDWTSLNVLMRSSRQAIKPGHFINCEGIVAGLAQRASVAEKNECTIAYPSFNMSSLEYWDGLGSRSKSKFTGCTVQVSLNTLHKEMTSIWNFHDPDDLLHKPQFLKAVRALAQGVTLMNESRFSPLAYVAPDVELHSWFVELLAQPYRPTPQVITSVMAYLVAMVSVLNGLFHMTKHSVGPLTEGHVDEAIKTVTSSRLAAVYRDVRELAGKAETAGELGVIHLINQPPPQGFCWRLLFPLDHDYVNNLAEIPFVPVSAIKKTSGFQTTERLSFELRNDYIHICQDSKGMSAQDLVLVMPNGTMVGGQQLSNPSRKTHINIPTTIWLDRATHDSYLRTCLRAAVKSVPFQTWDEVDNFQHWSGGWCYLRLVSTSPQDAAKVMLLSSPTMRWSSIFDMGLGIGNDDVKFDVHVTPTSSHITYGPHGAHTLRSYKALLEAGV